MSKICLGIDVAKKTLDVALLFNERTLTKQFANSEAGFKLLAAWLKSLQITHAHVCLEATGFYSEAIALFMHDGGHRVSLCNPLKIKGYAQARLQRQKTDRADARLIASFCLSQEPEQWFPPSPEVRHLQALVRRIEVLEQLLQAERNRLATSAPEVHASLHRVIGSLESEIKQLETEIKEHINSHPHLKEQSHLLQTIPGIGERTANLLLSEVEFARFNSARAVVAAQAGVVPRQRQSGTSLKQTNLSKLGNARLRKGLYFPAIVAKQHNEIIKEFAARLKKNGKTPMQIVCAAMRKLLHIAFGVLKHKRPFDSNSDVSA